MIPRLDPTAPASPWSQHWKVRALRLPMKLLAVVTAKLVPGKRAAGPSSSAGSVVAGVRCRPLPLRSVPLRTSQTAR